MPIMMTYSLSSMTTNMKNFPFQRFSFAPNSVCIKPETFYCGDKNNATLKFKMRNVPGEGDCMFLAVALATSASMGLGGNNALLRAVANETREVVANVLSAPTGHFHVEKKRIVRASDLLLSAAKSESVDASTYLEILRNGSLQGGGAELTVLSNVLRRPISVYELDEGAECNVISTKINDDEPSESNMEGDECLNSHNSVPPIPSKYRIKCVGLFGDIFKDPCTEIPNSAVLENLQEGAYSWHIHILIVDAGEGEKHACALLPRF